jgi:hypothetical protein
LWRGIDARIQAKPTRSNVVPLRVAGVAALAGSALVAAAAAWFVYARPPAPKPTESPVASVAPAPAVSAPSPAPTAIVPEEASYRQALAALAPTYLQRKAQLPPADAAKVETSLRAIETARAATRAALTQEPDDPDLRAELDAEYEQEIQTMNDVLDWTTRS